jgi:pimeloyl-ACP methyl ester carboxylesterase
MDIVTEEVSFVSEGARVSAALRRPADAHAAAPAKRAAVVFCAGFSLTKEVWLPPYAEALVARGYTTLNFDYRGFGASEAAGAGPNAPRCRLVPSQQIEDTRNAITFLETRDDVDSERIALVGVSLGAAIALGAAGVDPRVRAMVAVAGPSDLWRTWSALPHFDRFHEKVRAARRAFVATGEVSYIAVSKLLSSDPETCAKIEADAPRFPSWRPEITFESLASLFELRPEQVAHQSRASCFVYCGEDALIGKREATSAFDKAREPKRLVELTGIRHAEIYGTGKGFAPCVDAIAQFLDEQVRPDAARL